MDITRLPTRNLSRDDRLISSHARDARYPFLDLDFVAYLSSLSIWVKCNPTFGEGAGDKMLLRIAAKKLGLEKTSARAKRAMQFGTRSSKMSVSKGPKAGERKVMA
jgi:asparagine synthetase B (glutamine-hydrolysing)